MYPFDLFNFVPAEVVVSFQLGAAVVFYYSIVFGAAVLALQIAYQPFQAAFFESANGNDTPPRERGPEVH